MVCNQLPPSGLGAISLCCRSVAGRRLVNEDKAAVLSPPGYRGVVVADGMGGHQAGEKASGLVVEGIQALVNQQTSEPDLLAGIQELSDRIYHRASHDPTLHGMGSTFVLALTDGAVFWVYNVGDSRAYLLEDGEIAQISMDHTVIQDSLNRGLITEKEIHKHPYRHALLQCVGHSDTPIPAIYGPKELKEGQVLILGSDGLTGFVSEFEILDVLLRTSTIEEAANYMIRLALFNGSDDNVTVGLIEIGKLPRESDRLPVLPHASLIPGRNSGRLKVGLGALSLILSLPLGVLVYHSSFRPVAQLQGGAGGSSNVTVPSIQASSEDSPPNIRPSNDLAETEKDRKYQDGPKAHSFSPSNKTAGIAEGDDVWPDVKGVADAGGSPPRLAPECLPEFDPTLLPVGRLQLRLLISETGKVERSICRGGSLEGNKLSDFVSVLRFRPAQTEGRPSRVWVEAVVGTDSDFYLEFPELGWRIPLKAPREE
jgi:PPM family protein phosphatase